MLLHIDEVTKQLKILNNKKLSWVPTIDTLFAYLMDSVTDLFIDVDNNAVSTTSSPWRRPSNVSPEIPHKQGDLLIALAGHNHRGIINDEIRNHFVPTERMAEIKSTERHIDWRNKGRSNFITSVKNQGFAAACVAFGIIGAMEGVSNIINGTPVRAGEKEINLSEQHLFFYNEQAQKGEAGCLNGWNMLNAVDYAKREGVLPAKDFYDYNPYNKSLRPPEKQLPHNWRQMTYRITDYHILWNLTGKTKERTEKTRKNMKAALQEYGPIVSQIRMSPDLLLYKEGVYRNILPPPQGLESMGHCITCVGFDDKRGAWLCKNSWGTHWGEDGYVWIKYGEVGIEDMAIVIKGIGKNK
jgi:C1A family cysteine protease